MAEILGGLLDENNKEYVDVCRNKFPDAVKRWENRPGMVIVRVRPTFIATAGATIDHQAYLDLENETAYSKKWAYY